MNRATKEELAAELNGSERDKAVANIRELMAEFEEWEASVYAAEQEVWQPHWSRRDPIRDRLLRIGVSVEMATEAQRNLDVAATIIRAGIILPATKKQLNAEAQVERSALDQLAAIAGRRA